MPTLPWSSILVATAWKPEDRGAFAHGLALALAGRARLTVAHVGAPGDADEEGAPGVRAWLARWGVLPAGAPRSAVGNLGLDVVKARIEANDPLHGIAFEADVEHVDLVVVGHQHRDGLARLIHPSLAARAVRQLHRPVLVVPDGPRGFVDPDHGRHALRRVLVAADIDPSPLPALRALAHLAATLGGEPPDVVVAHIGDAPLRPPPVDGLPVRWLHAPGPVVDTLLRLAEAHGADLLALTTAGRTGAVDALLGSTAERLLAEARLPLLVATQR